MSLSFVLKLLICQPFISVYFCRFSACALYRSQPPRKPGETSHLERVDPGTSCTFEEFWLVLSPPGWFNCQETGKQNHAKEFFIGNGTRVSVPSGCQESLQLLSKGVRNSILAGHTTAQSAGRRSALRSSLRLGERPPILSGLLLITFCSFT